MAADIPIPVVSSFPTYLMSFKTSTFGLPLFEGNVPYYLLCSMKCSLTPSILAFTPSCLYPKEFPKEPPISIYAGSNSITLCYPIKLVLIGLVYLVGFLLKGG